MVGVVKTTDELDSPNLEEDALRGKVELPVRLPSDFAGALDVSEEGGIARNRDRGLEGNRGSIPS